MSLISVFIASLLGSPHCAGMCGGFVAIYSTNSKNPFLSHVTYHLGRLLTYTMVGALAGAAGQSIDNWAAVVGVQRVSMVATGLLLLYWGCRGLFEAISVRKSRSSLVNKEGVFFSRILSLYQRVLSAKDGEANWVLRAFTIGMLSTLLPCGWLYAFVAVAASSGDGISGVIVMAVFWCGTVPILGTLGGATRILNEKFGKRAPVIANILLIAAGLFSLFGHYQMSISPHAHH